MSVTAMLVTSAQKTTQLLFPNLAAQADATCHNEYRCACCTNCILVQPQKRNCCNGASGYYCGSWKALRNYCWSSC